MSGQIEDQPISILTNNWRVNAIYHFPDFTSSKGFSARLKTAGGPAESYSLQSGYPMTAFLGSNRSTDGDNIG